MIHNIVELKHGNINARLLFCNRAYRDARGELGNLFSMDDLGNSVKQANFLFSYLYQSYKCACKEESKDISIGFIEFDEALSMNDIPVTESNLSEIFDKAAESVKVYFGVEINNVKKKVEEWTSKNPSQPMTNSNNYSAENLDTTHTNSGTDLRGDSQTTSYEAIINDVEKNTIEAY